MKRILFIFSTLLLFATAAMVSSCNDDEIFLADDYSDKESIEKFFQKEYLAKTYLGEDWGDNAFFGKSRNDTCILILNQEDFLRSYHGNFPLPEVDFSRFSLVVGQSVVEQYGYSIESQVLVSKSKEYQLNLYVNLGEGYHEQAMDLVRFWGCYPKLQKKNIYVNLIKTINHEK